VRTMTTIRSESRPDFRLPDYSIHSSELKKKSASRQFRRKFRGLRLHGKSSKLIYRHQQPETANSAWYEEYTNEIDNLICKELPDYKYLEYRPPEMSDIDEHLMGFTKNTLIERPSVTLDMSAAVCVLGHVLDYKSAPISGWFSLTRLVSIKVGRTFPGIAYRAAGFNSKEDAWHLAVPRVTEIMKEFENSGALPGQSICKIGCRGKIVDVRHRTGKKEGRLILMPDLDYHLFASLASKSYTRILRNFRQDIGGIMVGIGPYHGCWRRLGNYLKGATTYTMIDFSGFDQSLPGWLIRTAFNFVKKSFVPATAYDSNYWDYMYNNLVETLIAYPTGEILQKLAGVASGDPWTSIIGSVCNYIILGSVLDPRFYRIYVFGDDSIIAYFKDGVPNLIEIPISCEASSAWGGDTLLTLEQISIMVNSRYGVTVSVKKSFTCNTLYMTDASILRGEWDLHAQFLSLYFHEDGHPVKRTQDVLEHLMCPEFGRNSINWEKLRTLSYYVNSFFNPVLENHILNYFSYLKSLSPDPISLNRQQFEYLSQMGAFDDDLMGGYFVSLPKISTIMELYDYFARGSRTYEEYVVKYSFERRGLPCFAYG